MSAPRARGRRAAASVPPTRGRRPHPPTLSQAPARRAAPRGIAPRRPIAVAAAALPVTPTSECLVGPDLWAAAAAAGAAKAAAPLGRVLPLGILAGVFIGFGASLAFSVGGTLTGATHPALQRLVFGAYGFPMGLLAIAVLGGELFTGNAFAFFAALAEKKTTLKPVLVRAALTWVANGLGVALVAALLSVGPAPPAAAPAAAAAAAKAALPIPVMLARSVLCNVCVCIAVLQATASRSLAGKAAGIWFPLAAFASLGFEHSIANQYVFALAALQGASPGWAGVATNLAAVTLGNVVGAVVILGGLMRAGHLTA